MGWRGVVRSLNAAMRAAEREAERNRKHELKARIASEATQAVDEWKTHIDDLISVHVDLADAIDWHAIASSQIPAEPIVITKSRDVLAPKLKNFKPGIFDFLFGGTDRRKQNLIEKFRSARERDLAEHKIALEKHSTELADWQVDNVIARRLCSGEAEAIKEVISELQTISEEGLIGNNVLFKVEEGFLHAVPSVHTDDVVPDFRRKQLASGRLSETKMPVGQFNELYQDYVSSVALKIAGDLFHIVPMEELCVTCCTTMLNSQTGHQELTPILSVQFVRHT